MGYGQNSTFSENGHDAYQIKENQLSDSLHAWLITKPPFKTMISSLITRRWFKPQTDSMT